MITIPLMTEYETDEDRSFVFEKQMMHSYARIKMYKHASEMDYNNFKALIKQKYGLNTLEYDTIKRLVKADLEHTQIWKDKITDKIIKLTSKIKDLELKDKLTNKEKWQLKKYKKLLKYNNKSLSKDITFGGISNLRKISKLSNNKELNKDQLDKRYNDFYGRRLINANYIGCYSRRNSNEHFEFDLEHNLIYYKPYCKKRIKIKVHTNSKNYRKYLLVLDKVTNAKLLPIYVTIGADNLTITFDEKILYGYGLNNRELKEESKGVTDKEERNIIYRKYCLEQENRMLKNKVSNRYCAVDLNPAYIGLAIVDKEDKEFKVIFKKAYDLTKLIEKSGESSDHPKSKYMHNKLDHELKEIMNDIFKTVNHYKCANFVIEDLNFKDKLINEECKEFNRITKNKWCRILQTRLIKKHCNINGIKLLEVNPVYSSFIGNCTYKDFDPINAAVELARRGAFQYTKNYGFYPELTQTILNTLILRGCDDSILKAVSWAELFNHIKQTEFRYRWQIDETNHQCFSHDLKRNKWKTYSFE